MLFYFLILRCLKFEFYNLFIFFLPLYKVSIICEFVRVIHVVLVYMFGGVFFFSHVVKKKLVKRKITLLNFIKSMNLFTCLADWPDLQVWLFFFFFKKLFSSILFLDIENSVSQLKSIQYVIISLLFFKSCHLEVFFLKLTHVFTSYLSYLLIYKIYWFKSG